MLKISETAIVLNLGVRYSDAHGNNLPDESKLKRKKCAMTGLNFGSVLVCDNRLANSSYMSKYVPFLKTNKFIVNIQLYCEYF